MKRREFVKTTAAFTTLSVMGQSVLSGTLLKPQQPIGLQLYTVRDQIKENLEGTIEQVAKTGYTVVEGAGYNNRTFYGLKPGEFKSLLDSVGLKMVSSHTNTKSLRDNADTTFEDAAGAGAAYVVLAWLGPNERKTMDDYKVVVDVLNEAGEKAKNYGIKVCYHNHDFEFQTLDGMMPYHLLMEKTDPELVGMVLDLYWAIKAGHDPLELFEMHSGRFPLWHVKDMDNTPEQNFTEVGNGIIDFQKIFDKDEEAGLKYFFVEQDRCNRPPLESIKISYQNVEKLN